MASLPTFKSIEAAAARIGEYVVRTPLLESPALNARAGRRVLVKAECLQVTGAFKARGAFNRLLQLSDAERERGVVACSSGNHAQAVAFAASRIGTSARIVMPSDAPAIKLERTRAWGADVVLYDRTGEDREAIMRGIAGDEGRVMVPPFDDPDILAGQGTAALELFAEAAARAIAIEALIVPTSGGGLSGGSALAAHSLSPATSVFTAEPAGFDDMARSLEAGERQTNAPGASSFCDALQTPTPGEITFPVLQAHARGGVSVTDAEVGAAMRAAFADLKLVVEPGGAVGLAAVLSGKLPATDGVVTVIVSGGNVDPALFARVIGQADEPGA